MERNRDKPDKYHVYVSYSRIVIGYFMELQLQ